MLIFFVLGQFSSPCGVTVDKNGLIVVSDNLNYRIQIFSKEGTPPPLWFLELTLLVGEFLAQFGSNGTGPNQLFYSKQVTLGYDGSILVVEDGNNRIQVFN